jgi:hypothetical protein
MIIRLAIAGLAAAGLAGPAAAFEFINAPPSPTVQSYGLADPGSSGSGKKPYDWTGFYVGATTGGAFTLDSRSMSAPLASLGSGLKPWSAPTLPPVTFDAVPSFGAGSLGFSQSTPFSKGLTAGYNLQLSDHVVVGIEGDMASFGQASPMPGWTGLQQPSGTAGSVRAKAGYVTDTFQFFVSGGVVSAPAGSFGLLP